MSDVNPSSAANHLSQSIIHQSLFENHPDAIYVMNLQGEFFDANAAALELAGYSYKEFLQTSFDQLIVSGEIEKTKAHFSKSTQGEVQQFEIIIIHKDGHHIDVDVTNIPIIVEGSIVGVYGTAKDITERMHTQRELKAAKNQLESFIANNVDAISINNYDGIIMRVNHAFEKLYGWKEEELIGKHPLEIPLIPKHLYSEAKKIINNLRQAKPIEGYETIRTTKHGEIKNVFVSASLTYDEYGNMDGWAVIYRDITERKRTEELLIQTEKLSIAGQLAAGVAHEIRNPLTAIKGFVQLMQESKDGNERYLQIISSEMNRIELIISELLVLAKPQVVTWSQMSILNILNDVLELIETQTIMNNIVVETRFSSAIPMIDCDENQLKQVFINIIKNSVESMPRGGVIKVEVNKQTKYIQVRIVDEGSGIPKDQIPKLGDPFFSTKKNGTGLGIMISNKIIKMHGGELKISSQEKVGTTVHVLLPVST